MRRIGLFLAISVSTLAVAAATPYDGGALGNETATYSYDALGRLTGSSVAGGPNDSRITATCFDPAGNRVRYDVANAAPPACGAPTPTPTPAPTPTPTPTPTNQPPVANPDTAPSIAKCGSTNVNVTANDTDPEGNLPLTVTSVSGPAALTLSIVSASTVNVVSNGLPGTKTFTYTVQDSLGASSTGTVTITITQVNQCP